jgi:hypothetical protein
MGVHMTLPSCPVAMLARAYYDLRALSNHAGIPAECEGAINAAMFKVREAASHPAPTSAEGEAFHRFCLEVSTALLGDGIDDDLRRIESDSAQRMLRTMRVGEPAQAAA